MRITAREARWRSERPLTDEELELENDTEIDTFCEQINNFARNGRRSLKCANLSEKTIKWLERQGYDVFEQKRSQYYLISWEYAE